MAEKKVGSKRKRNQDKANKVVDKKKKTDKEKAEYEDFWDKYGTQLRKRATRTTPEKDKKSRTASKESHDSNYDAKCGEINPYTTVNPVAEHQISTKRMGRVLSDDTGFKAYNYNERFALQPKMPEIDEASQEELPEYGIPGQQTMADLVSNVNTEENLSVPIEGVIESDDPFAEAYKMIKESKSDSPGKSEKLKAIARTAADDSMQNADSQLTFPAFDPLFVFPEEENNKKKTGKRKKRTEKKKKNIPEEKPFDIDEKDIVTNHAAEPEITQEVQESTIASREKNKAKNRFFEILNDSKEPETTSLPFELNQKSDVRDALQGLKKIRIKETVRTAILFLLGIALLIISLQAKSENSTMSMTVYTVLSLIFLLLSVMVCLKELFAGLKDMLHLKASANSSSVLLMLAATVQIVVSLILGDAVADTLQLLTPTAILSLISLTLPKIILSQNSYLTTSVFTGSNSVSVLKNVSESGIEGSMKDAYVPDAGSIRYSANTFLASGLIAKLTNAIPKPFASGSVYAFFTLLSIIAGVGVGFIEKSAVIGITVWLGFLAVTMPTVYSLLSAVVLLKENKALSESRASLLTYRAAAELTDTKALIFSASDIIDREACSIHGVKAYGHTDPKQSTMFCASLITAADAPLESIIRHAVEDSGNDIPEADEILIRDREGIAGLVNGNKILLGTREFLTSNHIFVPKDDYEEKYVTGDRKLLFLSVNGEFCMLFIVSYHIKRSVSTFLKYLSKKGIKAVIYSADPNITGAYIEKKCKLKKDSVLEMTSIEGAYFRDTTSKIQNAVPADVFTDGKITSVAKLMRRAFALTAIRDFLPLLIYALSAVGAVVIAVPIFSGNIQIINNWYLLLIKLIGFATGVLIPSVYAKQNK